MLVHVALTPADFPVGGLETRVALVVDVFRASTVVVAACAAGCRGVVPVRDAAEALARAATFPPGEALLAGERGGEAIPGFDLGNSPLEFTPARVRGHSIILTTSNGTGAMLAAAAATAAAVAALTNLDAAARWAASQGRDVTILCAGTLSGFSLEDAVCAGLLVERLALTVPAVEASDAAVAAQRVGAHYAPRWDRLVEDSKWARQLTAMGRSADLHACLRAGSVTTVPIYQDGVIVPAAATGPLP